MWISPPLLVVATAHPCLPLYIDVVGSPFSIQKIPEKIQINYVDLSLPISPSYERTPLVWSLHWVGDVSTIRTPSCCCNSGSGGLLPPPSLDRRTEVVIESRTCASTTRCYTCGTTPIRVLNTARGL